MAYMIAVCHQKGGVAKTTTALALGACLAEQEQRTLLIDLDHSANLTTGLGLSPVKARKSAADILLGNDTLSSIRQETSIPRLDVVPSNGDMVTVSRFLSLRPQYEYLLHNSLTQNELAYDFVLMDCPPSLGHITMTALTAAHMALIPMQCEYYAVQSLSSVFKAIKATRAKSNPQLRFRLLITMFDRRGSLHSKIYNQVKQRYDNALLNTLIGFDSKLRESQMVGVPVTIHAPRTRAVQQYRSLAREIYAYVETQEIPQPA